MDLRWGGTHKGITAIQVDIKVRGLTPKLSAKRLKDLQGALSYP